MELTNRETTLKCIDSVISLGNEKYANDFAYQHKYLPKRLTALKAELRESETPE